MTYEYSRCTCRRWLSSRKEEEGEEEEGLSNCRRRGDLAESHSRNGKPRKYRFPCLMCRAVVNSFPSVVKRSPPPPPPPPPACIMVPAAARCRTSLPSRAQTSCSSSLFKARLPDLLQGNECETRRRRENDRFGNWLWIIQVQGFPGLKARRHRSLFGGCLPACLTGWSFRNKPEFIYPRSSDLDGCNFLNLLVYI